MDRQLAEMGIGLLSAFSTLLWFCMGRAGYQIVLRYGPKTVLWIRPMATPKYSKNLLVDQGCGKRFLNSAVSENIKSTGCSYVSPDVRDAGSHRP